MSREDSHVSSLAARKQLLVAESELNRQQLAEIANRWTADLVQLTGRAKSIGSVASVAVAAMTGLSCLMRRKPSGPSRPASRLQMILNAAGLALNLWRAFHERTRGRTTAGEDPRQPAD